MSATGRAYHDMVCVNAVDELEKTKKVRFNGFEKD